MVFCKVKHDCHSHFAPYFSRNEKEKNNMEKKLAETVKYTTICCKKKKQQQTISVSYSFFLNFRSFQIISRKT